MNVDTVSAPILCEPQFTFFFRGVEVFAEGFVDPADRSVGIMSDSFCVERLIAVDGSRTWVYDDEQHIINNVNYNLTDADALVVDRLYWDWYESYRRFYCWDSNEGGNPW